MQLSLGLSFDCRKDYISNLMLNLEKFQKIHHHPSKVKPTEDKTKDKLHKLNYKKKSFSLVITQVCKEYIRSQRIAVVILFLCNVI